MPSKLAGIFLAYNKVNVISRLVICLWIFLLNSFCKRKKERRHCIFIMNYSLGSPTWPLPFFSQAGHLLGRKSLGALTGFDWQKTTETRKCTGSTPQSSHTYAVLGVKHLRAEPCLPSLVISVLWFAWRPLGALQCTDVSVRFEWIRYSGLHGDH